MPSTGVGPVFGDYRCNVCELRASSIEIRSVYDDIFTWQVGLPHKTMREHHVLFGPCGCKMVAFQGYVIRTWEETEGEDVSW